MVDEVATAISNTAVAGMSREQGPASPQRCAGTWDPERTLLQQRPALDELGAEWRLGVPSAS